MTDLSAAAREAARMVDRASCFHTSPTKASVHPCADCLLDRIARALDAFAAARRDSAADADSNMLFYSGVLAALAVVTAHDEETLHHEIVQSVGADRLIATCEDEQDFEWAGFAKYAGLRGYRRPRWPAAQPPERPASVARPEEPRP